MNCNVNWLNLQLEIYLWNILWPYTKWKVSFLTYLSFIIKFKISPNHCLFDSTGLHSVKRPLTVALSHIIVCRETWIWRMDISVDKELTGWPQSMAWCPSEGQWGVVFLGLPLFNIFVGGMGSAPSASLLTTSSCVVQLTFTFQYLKGTRNPERIFSQSM